MNKTASVLTAALFVANGFLSPALAQFDDDLPPPPPMPGGSEPFQAPSPPSSKVGPGGVENRQHSPGGFGGKSNSESGMGSKEASILTKDQRGKLTASSIEDITNENFPETIDSFDFPNADIQDIVKAISELTGKNFIVDQGVRGKITIIAPSKITVAEAYKAFLSALAINGYAVVPSGKFLKIRTARNAQRDSIETYSGAYYPNSDQMITRIIHLKHISADAINRDLRILTSKDGEMSVYPQTNSIIISDYGANIDRVMKIISQLDVPGFDDQLEVIPVRFAKAKDIADLIDRIVNKGDKNKAGSPGAFSSGIPRFSGTSQGGKGSAYYMVIPDDRTNALIVVGNRSGIDRIKKLLLQLDFKIKPEDSGGVFVYYVKYGEAEKIQATIAGIAKEAGPKPGGTSAPQSPMISPVSGVSAGPQEIFGGDVKITADKGTNALIIVASKQDYEVVLNLLSKIDISRDQVFVESVIMEMKATDSFKYEIGYFQFNDGGGKSGFNSLTTSLTDLMGPTGGNGTILGFANGAKVDVTVPGSTQTTKINSLIGFINFLKVNANANVLSTPQLIAMDNQEAVIEVGDKVVTGSQSSTSPTGGTTVTPTFEDATIMLKIKPFISPSSGSIRMEVDTSIKQLSTASTPDAFKSSTQPLATRKVKTNIVIRNGDTAVLGGLTKEDDRETITKVPLLGDIPILGWLFKSRQNSKEKTNMLIFLTPKIIRTSEDNQKLLGQKLDQRLDYVKSVGGRDPYGATVDQLQKRAELSPTEEVPNSAAPIKK